MTRKRLRAGLGRGARQLQFFIARKVTAARLHRRHVAGSTWTIEDAATATRPARASARSAGARRAPPVERRPAIHGWLPPASAAADRDHVVDAVARSPAGALAGIRSGRIGLSAATAVLAQDVF